MTITERAYQIIELYAGKRSKRKGVFLSEVLHEYHGRQQVQQELRARHEATTVAEEAGVLVHNAVAMAGVTHG